MSESDDDKPESTETAEPKAQKGDADGLLDSSWDSLLGSKGSSGPVFAPPVAGKKPVPAPSVPSFVPPVAGAKPGAGPKPPDVAPRTSESSGSVAGEFSAPDPKEPESEAAESETAESETSEETSEKDEKDEKDEKAAESEGKPEDESEKDESEEEDEKTAEEDEKDTKDEEAAESEKDDEPDESEEDDDSSEDESAAAAKGDDDPPRSAKAEADAPPEGGSGGMLGILAVAAAVVLLVVFVSRSGKDDAADAGPSKPNKTAKAEPDAPRPAPRPPEVKTHAADPAVEALRERERAGESAGSETGAGETGADETGETGEAETGEAEGETGEAETGEAEITPPAKAGDPRDPSLVPAGTPDENVKAFTKLPVSIHDGPPIGGVGRSGIHVDEVSMGRGRDNNDCDDPTRSFSIEGTEYINVCIRAIHPREQETLRVIWEKDGQITRRGKMRIPENLHAYKTRAYLQVRPEYVGSWRVRIVPEGEEDIDLAVAEFTISN